MDAAERALCGRWSDEGPVVGGEPGHAGLVAEDAAAAQRAGWVDGEHREAAPLFKEEEAEVLDEGALAHARDAGDADAVRLASVREQLDEDLLGLAAVPGVVGLDEGDGAREHGAVVIQDPLDVLLDRELAATRRCGRCAHEAPWRSIPSAKPSCSSSSLAASAMTVPGPKMAAAPEA